MPAIKDDASTSIDSIAAAFAKDLTDEALAIQITRLDKDWLAKNTLAPSLNSLINIANSVRQGVGAPPIPTMKPLYGPVDAPDLTFSVSQNKNSKVRTPAEQAEQVAAGRSWVCWSSHMSDKARHILIKSAGKPIHEIRDLKLVLRRLDWKFEEFKDRWVALLKKHDLLNYKAKLAWGDGDEFHVEMPDSKLEQSDVRAQSCLAEYARLTRQNGHAKNAKFEKGYSALLKPHVDKYETKK